MHYFSDYEQIDSNEVYFGWSEEYEASFGKLKDFLTSTPILALPTEGEEFIVYCDAFGIGIDCDFIKQGYVITYSLR